MLYLLIILFLISTSALIIAILALHKQTKSEKYSANKKPALQNSASNPCADDETCGVLASWAPDGVCKSCCDDFYSLDDKNCSLCLKSAKIANPTGPCGSGKNPVPCCIPAMTVEPGSTRTTQPTCKVNISAESCHKQGGTYHSSCATYSMGGVSCQGDTENSCDDLCSACCQPLGSLECSVPAFFPGYPDNPNPIPSPIPRCLEYTLKNCHKATDWTSCVKAGMDAKKYCTSAPSSTKSGGNNSLDSCIMDNTADYGSCCVWGAS